MISTLCGKQGNLSINKVVIAYTKTICLGIIIASYCAINPFVRNLHYEEKLADSNPTLCFGFTWR